MLYRSVGEECIRPNLHCLSDARHRLFRTLEEAPGDRNREHYPAEKKRNVRFSVASGAVCLETDVFDSQDGAEARPERGMLKAFF